MCIIEDTVCGASATHHWRVRSYTHVRSDNDFNGVAPSRYTFIMLKCALYLLMTYICTFEGDRCKLWGTLQVNGIGTALKILFPEPRAEPDQGGGGGEAPPGSSSSSSSSIVLSRQEAVAVVHTLERLSASIAFAHEVREGTVNAK